MARWLAGWSDWVKLSSSMRKAWWVRIKSAKSFSTCVGEVLEGSRVANAAACVLIRRLGALDWRTETRSTAIFSVDVGPFLDKVAVVPAGVTGRKRGHCFSQWWGGSAAVLA